MALVSAEIPRHKWKRYLHSQLTLDSKQKVMHLMQDADSSYDDIRAGLMGTTAMTFGAAAEAIFTADKGKLTQLSLRQAADKMKRWVGKLTQDAATVGEAVDSMTVGVLCSLVVPEAKTYLDMLKATELQQFLMVAEEWERSQPDK